MSVGRVTTPDTLIRLAELLFIEAVQRYLAALPAEESQWCAAIADPKLAHAIGLLHGRLNYRWTVDELAREIGMSRSSFAERFTQAMGESPMHYLVQLRLNIASRRVRGSGDPIARVGVDVGYESEAAYNRAFKREFGTPPAAWRKTRALSNRS
jgi:transcriptional regulator GlxA family with amidase domain